MILMKIMMKQCISKEKIDCIFLTKDNYKELLEDDYPLALEKREDMSLKITETHIGVESYGIYMSKLYELNKWYVKESRDYEYSIWASYTKEEFDSKYLEVE